MASIESRTIRKWVSWSMLLVLIVSLAFWLFGRETLPWTLRIATGEEGGKYYEIGGQIGTNLQKRTGRKVTVHSTKGSGVNAELLRSRGAELAIIQGGSVNMRDLSVVTPLYPEFMLVVVRKGRAIKTITDLAGKRVALGKLGSGMRSSALTLLEQFELSPEEMRDSQHYFIDLISNVDLDAAIVTTGVHNPDLGRVFSTDNFELLPIRDAAAVEMRNAYFHIAEIPRGLFGERPPIPPEATPTLATTAYLAARVDAPDKLVTAALASVHEENLRLATPTLFDRREAPRYVPTRMHPAATRYFHPSDQIGWVANVMESLAAGKELLFAIGAGVYLLLIRWQRLKKQELDKSISRQKEHLDVFLERTLRIEEAQRNESDVAKLKEYMDDVTKLKLQALYEFTEEELRSDSAFTIFLAQCANLISKIQLKIVALARHE